MRSSIMRSTKAWALVVVAALMTVGMAACGNGLVGGAGQSGSAKPRIAFLVPVAANPYWALEISYAKAASDQLGIDLAVSDANSSEDTQINQVQSAISSGAKGIVLSPVTDAVGKTALKNAESAGIPVTFMQRSPGIKPSEYSGKSFVGYVGTDDVKGGETTARALYQAGARRVVAITGAQGNSAAEDRLKGFMDFVGQHPDMKVLQTQWGDELREDGQKTTENLLSAFPGPAFNAVWAFNDETALGASKALTQAGDAKTMVSGMDGTPEGVQAVIDGKFLTAPGGGEIDGAFALVMLDDFLHGQKPKNGYVQIPLVNVDSHNAQQYKDFLNNPGSFDFKAISSTETKGASTDDYVIKLK